MRPGAWDSWWNLRPDTRNTSCGWDSRPETWDPVGGTKDPGSLLYMGPEARDRNTKSGTWDPRFRKCLAGVTRVQRANVGPKHRTHYKYMQQQNQRCNIWDLKKVLYLMPELKIWFLRFKKKWPKWKHRSGVWARQIRDQNFPK